MIEEDLRANHGQKFSSYEHKQKTLSDQGHKEYVVLMDFFL